MKKRPVDIARQLHISTSTLRGYEESGLLPSVERTPAGYRIYTDEHIAYFLCIREMLHGFPLSEIKTMLNQVMEHDTDGALWTANKAQAALKNDWDICENIKERFLRKRRRFSDKKEFTIEAASKATGVNSSTIRYWDRVGLITAGRCSANNYRTFTQTNIDEILILQTLKFAMHARGEKYAVEQIRLEMQRFDTEDQNHLLALTAAIDHYLSEVNRARMRSISALYKLCIQADAGLYEA